MLKGKWKRLIATSVVCTGLLNGLLSTNAMASGLPEETADENAHQYETVAHRGASGYAPENTMAAFEKAVEMKADYFELDVQMSKDGELVVIHDTTVNRTTDIDSEEPVKVGSLTLEELKQLDAGSYFGEEFTGERIPTLEEVLDEFRGKIGIVIEIKAPYLYPGIEQKIANVLIERGMDKPNNEKLMIQSFDFSSVKKIHKLLPEVPTAVLTWKSEDITDSALKEFTEYADYVNTSLGLVTKELVDRIHSLGMGIMPWTVRDAEQVSPLLNAGVDGIITDYPDYVPKN